MAITAVSVYNTMANWQGIAIVSLMFALVNIPSSEFVDIRWAKTANLAQ